MCAMGLAIGANASEPWPSCTEEWDFALPDTWVPLLADSLRKKRGLFSAAIANWRDTGL
jgi:hypothetical protein